MADRRLYYKLNQAQHLLSKRIDAELVSVLGIKTVQLGAVFFLLEHDGCMLKELSAGLGLNNSAITTLVVRMEEAGLLKRVSCSVDGRSYRLFLTEKAKLIGQKAIPLTKDLNARLAQGFSDEEINTVIRFLDSITAIAAGEWKMESRV
jgi:MarR family transcriptional regulator, organic hydroperoxide resistance regulator